MNDDRTMGWISSRGMHRTEAANNCWARCFSRIKVTPTFSFFTGFSTWTLKESDQVPGAFYSGLLNKVLYFVLPSLTVTLSVSRGVQYCTGWVITLLSNPKITQLAQLQSGPHYTASQRKREKYSTNQNKEGKRRYKKGQRLDGRCWLNWSVRGSGLTWWHDDVLAMLRPPTLPSCSFALLLRPPVFATDLDPGRCSSRASRRKRHPHAQHFLHVVRVGYSWVTAREACLCKTLQRELVKENYVEGEGRANNGLMLTHARPLYIDLYLTHPNLPTKSTKNSGIGNPTKCWLNEGRIQPQTPESWTLNY